VRRRAPLIGWLTAEAVSLCGTRLSMIAIPWFVLVTTGSATTTGLVAFAEMGPYVLAKAAAGPLMDRLGAARVSVAADAASAVVVLLIPLLELLDVLSLPVLLLVVALAGLLRGPGDGAKSALVPEVVEATGVPMERATGLHSAAERLASTAGAALAGLLVAVLGPVNALLIDAGSFAVAAALIAATAPRRAPIVGEADGTGYLTQLREGWNFLRGDAVLVAMTVMISITNLLDQAYVVVLVPVWAYQNGQGVAAVGLLFAVFAAAATIRAAVEADRTALSVAPATRFAASGASSFSGISGGVLSASAWATSATASAVDSAGCCAAASAASRFFWPSSPVSKVGW